MRLSIDCLLLPRILAALFLVIGGLDGIAQELTITSGVRTYVALTNSSVVLDGACELRLSAATNPLPSTVVNLKSADAWVFFPNIAPSILAANYLTNFQVNGSAMRNGVNARIVQYGMGSVVIPHAASLRPLQVFTGAQFTGSSLNLAQFANYSDASLGAFNNAIRSFKLKRGYMATFAQNGNGTGKSKTFVAQDGDLNVGVMPSGLAGAVSFVRVFPWHWAAKKGIAGNIGGPLNVRWFYNWNLDQNTAPDLEYVPIRQSRYWPDLNQDWRARGSTHLLGYNEPDRPDQANMAVADAIASWPDLLATGLRVGAPAVSDGGLNWLYSFIDQADAAGLRVDFVPLHYYWCYGNAADPDGTAGQFYNFLKGVYDRVQRPLWVTEWNNGANWTTCADPTFAQQQAAVSKMIAMLESAPFVERYALYNWVEDVRRVEWDDGSLTAAGVTYRDRASANSYVQEGAPGGARGVIRLAFEGDFLDSSGYLNNALGADCPSFTTGYIGQGIAMDGKFNYVQLPQNAANGTAFSFAAWVYWTGGGDWQRIFDFGNDTSHYIFLTPRSSAGTTRFVINDGTGEQILEAAALPSLRWQHVAVTLGGGVARIYLNGKVAATSIAFTKTPQSFLPKRNYLGKSQFPADPLFSGRFDEAAVSDAVFTAAEIAAMNAPVIRSYRVATDGSFIIAATASPGQTYALEANDFSASSGWTTVASAVATSAGGLNLSDPTATMASARMYRIVAQ